MKRRSYINIIGMLKSFKIYFLVAGALASVTIYSCKKEPSGITNQDDIASKILKINNNVSSSRLDLSNQGTILNFETVNQTANTASSYTHQLIYKGKINPLVGLSGKTLSALQVANMGTQYVIGYQLPGDGFDGGVDVVDLNSGNPSLSSTVHTPNADVTCVEAGGTRLYLGMDLKTYESFDFPAPAVVGIIGVHGGTLNNPDIVGIPAGYSTKDVKYNVINGKLYAASSTQGGVASYNFYSHKAVLESYAPYGLVRSITFSGNEVIATNGYSFTNYNPNTLAQTNYRWWPIQSNEINIGSVSTLKNGNFIFGNNYSLVYVDKTSGSLLDQIDVGGWITSVSVAKDPVDNNIENIFIATGNSLVIARIVNNKIEITAKTHFASTFGGDFNVISAFVAGKYVFVACGDKGTYVFEYKNL